eukprot:CAMPEP_0201592612 /NCGR_PEP_ID=MMETSP0190_2-20130828/190464_1 /ASSEMBLY_ACC=CAM_ASM_000263 /TAXON_ID=37353 /ORGANISM="Rosalina sp." /LENGTH=346 /DNA_ID=CAMNT_0048051473 /DNA_START=632 /DNA_END=1669 /DNA_ORIENTATION=+
MTSNAKREVKRSSMMERSSMLQNDLEALKLRLKSTNRKVEIYATKAAYEESRAKKVIKQNEELKKKMKGVIIWQWKENDGTWKSYNNAISTIIEGLCINESHEYTFSGNNQTYIITKTSEVRAIQKNKSTNVSREAKQTLNIRRDNEVLCPFWNMSGFDLNEQVNDIDTKYAVPALIELNLDVTLGRKLVNEFEKTCPNRRIVKIESIQNRMLYDSYWSAKKKLINLIGKNNLNIKHVYHGTSKLEVLDKVVKEGFRKEFNSTSLYGQGTYFARDAKYSVGRGYCSNKGDIYQILVCAVIMGQSHLGDRDIKLTTWPRKNGGKGLIYDSLVDNMNDPSIFVIHENA